jgi:hypothetical protein
LRDDRELIVLPHPIESTSLKSADGSWASAALNGRILWFTNLICSGCGEINKTACVRSGGLGCTTGIASGGLMIAVNLLFLKAHWLIELVLFWLALLAPSVACDFYVRNRHSDKAAPYIFSQCTNCGGTDAIPLAAAKDRKLPCARCGRESVEITIAAKS